MPKRVNYYDHQFLRAPDFTDEQSYHVSMRRLHNSKLHTWGIVEGLQVTVASGTAISVSAGSAIDSQGREIILPAATNLELGGESPNTTLFITIAYDEQQSDPTSEAGGAGNTRITENPKLSFSKNAPQDTSVTLVLAKVPRTSTGLGTVDGSDRNLAGVKLGDDLTLNKLTLKKDGVAPTSWPVLSCSAANQATFANAGLVLNGSVGIGPAAPNRNLSISASGTTGAFANIKNGSHEVLLGVDNTAILSAMTASDLQIRTNNTTRMVVQANTGNIGIGTSGPPNPDRNLTIFVPGAGTGVYANVKNGSHEVLLGVDNTAILSAMTASDLQLRTNNTTRAVIAANTGVLTANSAVQLGNSDIYFTKTDHSYGGTPDLGNTLGFASIQNDGNTYKALMILGRTISTNPYIRVVQIWDRLEVPNGEALKPGGGSWGAFSDRKLKKNIAPLQGALEKLLRLRGVSFEWKDPKQHGNLVGLQTGLVAQDVEEVFPEWVGQDAEGTKSVSVRGFEALVVEALREIKQEIETTKEAIAEI
jgi:hypothetical protein